MAEVEVVTTLPVKHDGNLHIEGTKLRMEREAAEAIPWAVQILREPEPVARSEDEASEGEAITSVEPSAIAEMGVKALKTELKARGLKVGGAKADLQDRLLEAIANEEE